MTELANSKMNVEDAVGMWTALEDIRRNRQSFTFHARAHRYE